MEGGYTDKKKVALHLRKGVKFHDAASSNAEP